MSGENNNGLVTPSEDNIKALYKGSRYEGMVDTVLKWFNEQGIIQRAPGGLYSVQFSALPSGEIEEKKKEMRNVQFRFTHQILNFSDVAATIFEKKFMQKVIRPYNYKFRRSKRLVLTQSDKEWAQRDEGQCFILCPAYGSQQS